MKRNIKYELGAVCSFVYTDEMKIYESQDVIQYMCDFPFLIYYC